MNTFAKIAEKIIAEQETIIGPIAIEQAQKVKGLTINWKKHSITFHGNETHILEKLVEQYQAIFGQASVEVCKEAAKDLMKTLSPKQIPTLLQGK